MHVGHAIIDGVIDTERTREWKFEKEDAKISADAVSFSFFIFIFFFFLESSFRWLFWWAREKGEHEMGREGKGRLSRWTYKEIKLSSFEGDILICLCV